MTQSKQKEHSGETKDRREAYLLQLGESSSTLVLSVSAVLKAELLRAAVALEGQEVELLAAIIGAVLTEVWELHYVCCRGTAARKQGECLKMFFVKSTNA